jgi:hypothetical protein
MPIFSDINTATMHYGYGNLKMPHLLHACGPTTTGDMVWLPIIRPQHSWDNRYFGDLIFQFANSFGTRSAYYTGTLLGNRLQTITRTAIRPGITSRVFDFEYRGEYCDVLFDPSQYLCIHAKIGSKYASGNLVGNYPDAFWTSGFALSWNDAKNILHKYCPDKYP